MAVDQSTRPRVTAPPASNGRPFPRYRRPRVHHDPRRTGIRPEDIHDHEILGGIPVEVKIAAIEALGPETVVVGEIAGVAEVSARFDRTFSAPIGSIQRFNFDPSQIHIFDAQTTLAFPREQT